MNTWNCYLICHSPTQGALCFNEFFFCIWSLIFLFRCAYHHDGYLMGSGYILFENITLKITITRENDSYIWNCTVELEPQKKICFADQKMHFAD